MLGGSNAGGSKCWGGLECWGFKMLGGEGGLKCWGFKMLEEMKCTRRVEKWGGGKSGEGQQNSKGVWKPVALKFRGKGRGGDYYCGWGVTIFSMNGKQRASKGLEV